MKHTLFKTLAAAGLAAASATVAQAQPYAVGVFNGWNPSSTQMTGGPTVYSYVASGGTAGNVDEFKILANSGDWNSTYTPNNVWTKFDATGGNTFYFYPGVAADGWEPAANRVGYADPGNVAFEIAGDFTNPNWSSDPSAQMGSAGNGVYTNLYVVPTAGSHLFKFRTPGTWNDAQVGTDFGENTGNGTFTTTNANQPVLFQLDLPNGRWVAGNPTPPPVTNYVVFAVDMSSQILGGFFTPGNSVYVSGNFNSWAGTSSSALQLTNYPPYLGGSNTNIYYGTNTFLATPGTLATDYKFTDNSPTLPAGDNGYEELTTDRTYTMATTNGVILLPVAMFSNLIIDPLDYLPTDTMVTFVLNMNGAHTAAGLTPAISPSVSYDSSSMPAPYINGDFLDGGWVDAGQPWNPIDFATAGIQMTENPVGSQIYYYTYTVKAGHSLAVHYKYAFNDGNGDSIDNEAPPGQNHLRYIRSTVTGSYTNAMDTYGTQLQEPSFGQLSLGAPASGKIPLNWLGRPGVQLQTCTNLLNNSWVTHPETDGTNWTSGIMTTNGLLSSTNWPAGNNAYFFRLLKL